MTRTIFLMSLCLVLSLSGQGQTYASSNFTLISKLDPETTTNSDNKKYSGCWGWWQSSKNKEYAIACSHAGTYWIDISSPASPSVCAYRAGKISGCTWREAKTYGNFCYVVSDDMGNNSLQIFDMQYLPDSVHKVFDGNSLFERAHTIYVDSNKLYAASVTYSTGGYSSMNVYSLATPTNPVLIRSLPQDFPAVTGVHDMFVRRDTVYASCQYQGLYVFRLTASNTFSLLGSLTSYPYSGYNHSSALTPDGKTLVFMDEVPSGLPIKAADVTNLSNIQILSSFNQFSLTTPHNPFIVNNQYCFTSCYEDGLQLYDISSPQTPVLAGYFDTHPQSGGNTGTWNNDYNGQWGCYPYLPSKTIFALDRYNGAFFLKTHLYQNGTTPVDVKTTAPAETLRVFPNPAGTDLSIVIPNGFGAATEVVVYNSEGSLIYTSAEAHEGRVLQLNVRDWQAGIYLIQLKSGKGLITGTRFLIQH